jgi:thiol-disulfide isomerase/thioredoxin
MHAGRGAKHNEGMPLTHFPLSRAMRAVAMILALLAAPAALAFDLIDTQGKSHRLADYQGRWVVINFWATWCVPCIQEIPEIAEFQREHTRVVVIGVAMDEGGAAKVKRFAARFGHTYPLVLADDKVTRQLGEPKALPTTRVFDPSGKVVYDRVGRVTKKSLEELTRSRPSTKALAPSAQRSRSAAITSRGYAGLPRLPL